MTKKKGHSILVFFLLFSGIVSAQNKPGTVKLRFNVLFNRHPLELNKNYVSANNDTVSIASFRFYVSDIMLTHSENQPNKQQKRFHLLDVENPGSMVVPLNTHIGKQIKEIIFNIGIDSETSQSGNFEGDLDPINGMYWAWQSGYINMKIEGKSSSCNTRGNAFQFHIGGYREPFYAMRTIRLKPKMNNETIDIIIDLAAFFNETDLPNENSVMIPGSKAVQLADRSVKMFLSE